MSVLKIVAIQRLKSKKSLAENEIQDKKYEQKKIKFPSNNVKDTKKLIIPSIMLEQEEENDVLMSFFYDENEDEDEDIQLINSVRQGKKMIKTFYDDLEEINIVEEPNLSSSEEKIK